MQLDEAQLIHLLLTDYLKVEKQELKIAMRGIDIMTREIQALQAPKNNNNECDDEAVA